MDRTSILGIITIILFVSAVLLILFQRKREKNDRDIPEKKRKMTLSFSGKFAIFASKNKLMRRRYNKVREQVAILNPADSHTLERITGATLLRAYSVAAGCVVLVIILEISSGFDLFYILAGIMASIVMVKVITEGRLKKLKERLLEEEREAFSGIRHLYAQLNRVDTAIFEYIPHAGAVVKPHLEDIYDIVSSPKMMEKSEEYAARKPDRFLLMFLSICTAIEEYGDSTLPSGQKLFMEDIGYLKEEVEAEILATKKRKIAFSGVVVITLIPLIAIKPLEIWAVSNMPTIAQYYTGLYSTVSIMGTFIYTYLAYTVIDMMMDSSESKQKSNSIWAKISSISFVSTILSRHINKNYTKWMRTDSLLRGIGDHTGPKAFLLKRIAYTIAGFILTLVVFIAGTKMSQSELLNNFKEDYKNSIQIADDYKDSMRNMAKELTELHILQDDKAKEKDIMQEAKDKYNVNNLVAAEIAKAVVSHTEEYTTKYFYWWYLLLAIMIGIGANFIPYVILQMNKPLINSKRQDEVMQYQSLMLILMNIPGTSVATILEWMERYSSCFLESITTCRANLGRGQQKALEDMKNSEAYKPFKSFCDNLMSVDSVGIAAAFDEIATDHVYYMETKKQDREEDIKKKAKKAQFISMTPLYLVLFLYLILPMLRYALKMFMEFDNIK